MKLIVMTDIYIVLKKNYEIQDILTAKSDKRNELSRKYNRGVNITGVIAKCLGVTAIGFWYNKSWPSLNNRCCTSRNRNRSSINCYGITSSCGKSIIKKLCLEIEKHERLQFNVSCFIAYHYP